MARRVKSAHSRYGPLQISQHQDSYAPSALAGTPGFPRLFPAKTTDRWRRQMGRFTNQPRGPLLYPIPNGHYDPLCIAAVMDMLLRLEVGPYVTSGSLAHELNKHYEQIEWDPITVGRILADLHSFALLLTMPSEFHERPIYVRKFGGSKSYLLHNDPNGWQWLGKVRDYMGQQAEDFVRRNEKRRNVDIWEPVAGFKYGERVEA